MNDSREVEDQDLIKQLQAINQEDTTIQADNSDQKVFLGPESADEIDVLNLPPRSQVHDEENARLKWKVSYAFVRFFVIIFILIVVLVLTFNYWGEHFFPSSSPSEQPRNLVGDQVLVVNDSAILSEEVSRQLQLAPNEDSRTLRGRYYLTGEDDSLNSIIDRFYKSDSALLPLLLEINKLEVTADSQLEKNLRLFLPNLSE
ncbi:hypothetical protein SAMN04488134_10138 [Amphibacillus marinus]|uniref:LysM domain-containing protein n=1 Tax=Amphibacillus marinus TaxID=872970 RepID=A0A1H8GDB6_9BACI|nr:hypothetical protein [Amphibacillus marinus]SEN42002.1 hypothetical protein SAMN04488134_10138 [Amphibacillus marinus]